MNPIPLLDVRDGGPVAHAQARVHAAVALRDACLGAVAPLARCLSPIDQLASNWLRKSASTYRTELEHIAAILGFPGAVTLNMSYLFACTTQAYEGPDGLPRIRRTLDWPFRGLGEAVEMAWQSGPAGDFYNATWPGAVGVLSAMAPGRFCAVINQAPMLRRMKGNLGFALDAAINLHHALTSEGGWPPDHLLRYAFETCETFEEAVQLIAREPLARPTLFTLAGVKPGEMALIERTEREARIYRGPVIVANNWQEPQPGWQARMSQANNDARVSLMRSVAPDAPRFSWVTEPVLNRLTRLAVEMCSVGAGDFVARGYESRSLLKGSPHPVTQDFHLRAASPMALAA
ncbi:hypothetical protein OGR47_05140 [Methylocystis sp. MJC1]|jgi:hypothetical protein|uniref:hypothetical protein n=1 Tax=Methylocystis sp. MJC1 TaxID=2654282 RepID=UPI0013EE1978|nr:hypothetical protein [Methylocystis sp. MJC1]KAF2988850.1 hypothetical protein MJC1_04066 [Methylocystis sp. MJC1]MBU6526393.1 hypothetical protein [Methylocystis sp. MJC1]UZX12841.1 hypothetical protein OGR47_05140 [Methylocystis sp. MJC1]